MRDIFTFCYLIYLDFLHNFNAIFSWGYAWGTDYLKKAYAVAGLAIIYLIVWF